MKDPIIDEMSFIYAVFQPSASLTLQNQKDLLRLDELSSSGNTFVDAPLAQEGACRVRVLITYHHLYLYMSTTNVLARFFGAGLLAIAIVAMSMPVAVRADDENGTGIDTPAVECETGSHMEDGQCVADEEQEEQQTFAPQTFSFVNHHDDEDEDEDEGHKIDICHYEGNDAQILNIDENGWNGHEHHDHDFKIDGQHPKEGCVDLDDGDDEETPIENSCVAPTTLTSENVADVNNGSSLQSVLDAGSYGVDMQDDQTGSQQWNGSGTTVHFSAKFLNKSANDKHVFGYMLNGGSFVPVFKDDASIGGAYASVPVNGTNAFDTMGTNDVVFAIVDVSTSKTYTTRVADADNGGNVHVATYNPSSNTYVLAFEDQNLGDKDYNDLIVEVKVTGCEKANTATIVATKIVCDNESDLPNLMGSSHVTDEDTAADFLDGHPSCHLAKDWQFEWGNQSATDAGRDFVGHASGYTTSGMTATDGTVTMTVPLADVSEIHVREVLKEGYIPFTYDTDHQSDADTVSAELSCGTDGLHYDNFDFIRSPEKGHTYYCVAWNVAKPKAPVCDPEINLIANGDFEAPDVSTGSYDIIPDSNPLLKWLVAWTSPQDGGRLGLEIQDHVAGDPANGAQHAELDGDHPVTISQQIATVPGQEYTVSFNYSPRAGRDAADNTIVVKAAGNALGAALAADGTANANTVWAPYTRSFVASGATTLIEFADTGTDTSFGGYLDDVRVSCVADETPECEKGEHLNSDDVCVPDEPSCDEGEHFDGESCVPDEHEISDVCPNIEGVQSEVPEGKKLRDGQCLSSKNRSGGGGGSSGGQVLGASTCSPLLNSYLHKDWKNDPTEVSKLQDFLNTELGLTLPVNGIFDGTTEEAVKAFQKKYWELVLKPWIGLPASGISGEDTPTGFVYQTTRWEINNIFCPGSEAFPSTLN